MNSTALKSLIAEGALEKYSELYADTAAQRDRFIRAISEFEKKYGADRDIYIFSVPGRSEISGNHTDHNHGEVLAGAINRDIIAIASPNEDGIVRFQSEGYPESVISLADTDEPGAYPNYSSAALIAGVAHGLVINDYSIGGYDAYATTEVLKGSGISSSAAFEVMIGNIFNYLYNDGKIDNKEIAKISQYAENVFFGKPCGLMDQMACAVGGFVYIDFCEPKSPVVTPIAFSLAERGYSLCIVNTGGNHANLNEDYASVPAEMHAVASALGKSVLRETDMDTLVKSIPSLRESVGDRAILRAIHFLNENKRVAAARDALVSGDIDGLFGVILESGRSSFEYLQNVYTNQNVREQGLSLALALTEVFLSGKRAAYRVHGGGFAGTVQVFLPTSELDGYVRAMDAVFGEGAAMPLSIRPLGACRLF
ncbi:MAG: galactokinase [Clostridia bacterium]|nr:galactokinase [Clostridia bacterium]